MDDCGRGAFRSIPPQLFRSRAQCVIPQRGLESTACNICVRRRNPPIQPSRSSSDDLVGVQDYTITLICHGCSLPFDSSSSFKARAKSCWVQPKPRRRSTSPSAWFCSSTANMRMRSFRAVTNVSISSANLWGSRHTRNSHSPSL